MNTLKNILYHGFIFSLMIFGLMNCSGDGARFNFAELEDTLIEENANISDADETSVNDSTQSEPESIEQTHPTINADDFIAINESASAPVTAPEPKIESSDANTEIPAVLVSVSEFCQQAPNVDGLSVINANIIKLRYQSQCAHFQAPKPESSTGAYSISTESTTEAIPLTEVVADEIIELAEDCSVEPDTTGMTTLEANIARLDFAKECAAFTMPVATASDGSPLRIIESVPSNLLPSTQDSAQEVLSLFERNSSRPSTGAPSPADVLALF